MKFPQRKTYKDTCMIIIWNYVCVSFHKNSFGEWIIKFYAQEIQNTFFAKMHYSKKEQMGFQG